MLPLKLARVSMTITVVRIHTGCLRCVQEGSDLPSRTVQAPDVHLRSPLLAKYANLVQKSLGPIVGFGPDKTGDAHVTFFP